MTAEAEAEAAAEAEASQSEAAPTAAPSAAPTASPSSAPTGGPHRTSRVGAGISEPDGRKLSILPRYSPHGGALSLCGRRFKDFRGPSDRRLKGQLSVVSVHFNMSFGREKRPRIRRANKMCFFSFCSISSPPFFPPRTCSVSPFFLLFFLFFFFSFFSFFFF